jgi:2-keto-4-pentenoate hydratase/2-oxohepta-3-ene-1,7-dioic acid hydratase in catechol pathway
MALRLVLFQPGPRLGALLDDLSIADLRAAYASLLAKGDTAQRYREAGRLFPSQLASFIALGDVGLRAAREVVEALKGDGERRGLRGERLIYGLDEVRLLPPLPSPSNKLVCAAVNFASHTARVRRVSVEEARRWILDQLPGAFLKLWHVVLGPYDDLPYPKRTRKLDYELEVAAIVGRKSKDVGKEEAGRAIYGYSIFMDYSLRDAQDPRETLSLPMRKNFDGGACLGPCIVPREDVGDVYSLKMSLRVNGEERQAGSTAEMVRGFEELLSWFSRDLTFFPGDIITSGTCQGTALEKELEGDPSWYLKVGDVVEGKVEGIGRIRNRVVLGAGP